MKEKKQSEDTQKGEDKNKEGQEGFAKQGDELDHNKYNQALRKAREAEARARELEEEKKKLEELAKKKTPNQTPSSKKEEEDDEDDFWKDDEEDDGKIKKEKSYDPDYIKSLVDEKIKPFVESESNRMKIERKKARADFYDAHPEYLSDQEKWVELLEELDSSVKPSGDYYTDLEKAHRIISGEDVSRQQIEIRKREMATQAGNQGGSSKVPEKEGDLTDLDRKIMEGTGVDEETIKTMKQMEKDGLLSLEW
jgi:hypothetical protein